MPSAAGAAGKSGDPGGAPAQLELGIDSILFLISVHLCYRRAAGGAGETCLWNLRDTSRCIPSAADALLAGAENLTMPTTPPAACTLRPCASSIQVSILNVAVQMRWWRWARTQRCWRTAEPFLSFDNRLYLLKAYLCRRCAAGGGGEPGSAPVRRSSALHRQRHWRAGADLGPNRGGAGRQPRITSDAAACFIDFATGGRRSRTRLPHCLRTASSDY